MFFQSGCDPTFAAISRSTLGQRLAAGRGVGCKKLDVEGAVKFSWTTIDW